MCMRRRREDDCRNEDEQQARQGPPPSPMARPGQGAHSKGRDVTQPKAVAGGGGPRNDDGIVACWILQENVLSVSARLLGPGPDTQPPIIYYLR